MIKYKLLILSIYFKSLFCPCVKDNHLNGSHSFRSDVKISRVESLDTAVKECSGFAYMADSSGTPADYYALGDSGREPWLFRSNTDFTLVDTLKVPVKNKDWEELQIKGDTFYIGEIGNNRNNRKDQCFYRFRKGDTTLTQIKFHFQDQAAFPPSKDSLWYDAEAFLVYHDSLWIFTKTRGSKKGMTGKGSMIGKKSVLYAVPDQAGEHIVAPLRSFPLRSWIVGAAWSPDHQRFVLLSYGRLYFFKVGPKGLIDAQAEGCLRFPRGGQSEAVSWIKEKELLVTNEDGKVFQILFRK